MKRIIGFCLSILLIAVLAMACDNSVTGLMPVEDGKVAVSLGLETTKARTALPTAIESGWTYVLKGALSGDVQTELGSWTDLSQASMVLDEGSWDFTLTVMDDAEEIYVSTLADVALSSAPVHLVFTLVPRTTGTGTLDIKINVPAQVDHIGIVDPDSEDDTVDYFAVDGLVSIQKEMAAGSYIISFHVRNDVPRNIAQFTEVFVIRDKLTTSFTKTISEDELNTAPAAPTEFAYSVADETPGAYVVDFSWKDNSDNESSFWVYNGTRGIAYGLADEESCSYTFKQGGDFTLRLEAGNLAGKSSAVDTVSFSVPNGLAFDMNGGEDADGNTAKASVNVTFGDDYTIPDAGTFAKKQDGISLQLKEWTGSDGKIYQVGDTVAAADLASASGCFYLKAIWSTEKIGATGPAGGIVFYDDEADGTDDIPGVRYLEALILDTDHRFGTNGVASGATSRAVGAGPENTFKIVENDSLAGSAANACFAYSVDTNGVSYDDWFLPSRYEVDLIHNAGGILLDTGAIAETRYWSSTEVDDTTASLWTEDDDKWTAYFNGKSVTTSVVAIRGFNDAFAGSFVRYDVNGGSTTESTVAIFTEGSVFTAIDPDGKITPPTDTEFGGWEMTDGTIVQAGESLTVTTEDIVLTAVWAPARTVSYNGNGTGIENLDDVILNFSAPHDYTVAGAATYELPSGEVKKVIWSQDASDATVSAVVSGDVIQLSDHMTFYAHLEDYAIGAMGPAGGYIFYDKGSFADGWRYMEAGPADLGPDMWYTGSLRGIVTGAVDSAIGAGKANTEAIAAIGDSQLLMPVVCYNYSLDNNGVTYDDWFMPSRYEMVEMYTALIANGIGNFTGAYYWTSTEYDQRDAFVLTASTGVIIYNNINAVKRRNTPDTRPARMF